MARISGGELVVRTLRAAGVDMVFGLHGAHIDPIFQALSDHGIPIVDTRHEVAAGHAAEGYARLGNRLGVCMVTAGPGFTNVVTSLANARLDRTPMLCISGAAGLGQAETNTLQAGVDQVAIARPITKWAHQITTTRDIPRLLAQAIRMATSAPAGPVLIDLPVDVLNGTVDEGEAPIPDTVLLDSRAAPTASAVTAILDLVAKAKRPVLLAGAGAHRAGAAEPLRRFVEASGIPVFSDFAGHGLLPADHPLYGGTYHKLADLDGPDGRSDLVLAMGVRFGLFTVGASDLIVPHAARIIHVDDDPREIGLIRAVEIGLVANVAETLAALADAVAGRALPDTEDWRALIRRARDDRRARLEAESAVPAERIHPYRAVAAIAGALSADAVVVGDGAEAYHWLNEAIAQTRPGSYLTHGFLGAVGCGLGLALGAQAADRDRPVLCVTGDGAVGFTIAEFDTMVRQNLPIVVVVMNNRSWAASQHFQELAVGPNRVTSTRLAGARYDAVAAGFGCAAYHVTDIDTLGPTIREALAARRPACVNVEIDVGPIPPELHLLMRA